jgi:RNA recognition motif-containing protein
MKIFVSHLALDVGEELLRVWFQGYGKVTDVAIVRAKDTGESKGFGFVQMPNAREALAGIEHLNGSTWEDRTLVVEESHPKPSRYIARPSALLSDWRTKLSEAIIHNRA